jgi:6-phosphogluconate dehydrogenase
MAKIGIVGLGKMGANMAERLRRAGHHVVGFDRDEDSGRDVASLAELVQALPCPRVVWVMVPAGDPTYDTVRELHGLLEAGDVVVDGGNSRYTDDQQHAEELAGDGIGFVDAGVSGGVWGLTEGYALMVGGTGEDVAKVQPFFDALKPDGESGFAHAGPVGAGHFAKMVHNGIEYGLMQAYAEGWELLQAADIVTDVTAVLRSWRRARSSARGCWTCWSTPSSRTAICQSSAGTPRTPAKAAGRWRRRSITRSPCPSSPRRCSRGSPHANRTRRR